MRTDALQDIFFALSKGKLFHPDQWAILIPLLVENIDSNSDGTLRRWAYQVGAMSRNNNKLLVDYCIGHLDKESEIENRSWMVSILSSNLLQKDLYDVLSKRDHGLTSENIVLSTYLFSKQNVINFNDVIKNANPVSLMWLTYIGAYRPIAERNRIMPFITSKELSVLSGATNDDEVLKHVMFAFHLQDMFHINELHFSPFSYTSMGDQQKKWFFTLIWKDNSFVKKNIDYFREIMSVQHLFSPATEKEVRIGLARGLAKSAFINDLSHDVMEWYSHENSPSARYYLLQYIQANKMRNKSFKEIIDYQRQNGDMSLVELISLDKNNEEISLAYKIFDNKEVIATMKDGRIPLQQGQILTINTIPYIIIREPIGYGASCLVYEAEKQTEPKHKYIIKEFYPKDLADDGYIKRFGNTIEVVSEQAEFDRKKLRFIEGLAYQTKFTSENSSNSMQGYPDKVVANGTVYSLIGSAVGETLDKIDRNRLTLNEIAQIMQSLCIAVGYFHNKGLLYLDIKPENLFVYDKHITYRVGFFDFDSVLPNNKNILLDSDRPCSTMWCAPEQNPWDSSVGKASDVFSIGAVFYWLVSGRNIDRDLLDEICYNRFQQLDKCYGYDEATQEVKKILASTLVIEPTERNISVDYLANEFIELADKSKTGGVIYDGIKAIEKELKNMKAHKTIEQKGESKNFTQTDEKQLSDEYYNLFIVGYYDPSKSPINNCRIVISTDRAFASYVSNDVREIFGDLHNREIISKIKTLPSIFACENNLREFPNQGAAYGFITDIKIRENGINVYFKKVSTVSQQALNNISYNLAIKPFEWTHTHWTIKNVNLTEELIFAGLLECPKTICDGTRTNPGTVIIGDYISGIKVNGDYIASGGSKQIFAPVQNITMKQNGNGNVQIHSINGGAVNISLGGNDKKIESTQDDGHSKKELLKTDYKFKFTIDLNGNACDFSVDTVNAIREWFYDLAKEDLSKVSDDELINTFSVEISDERILQSQAKFNEINGKVSRGEKLDIEDEHYYSVHKKLLNLLAKENEIKAQAIKFYMSDRFGYGIFLTLEHYQLKDIILAILGFPYFKQFDLDNNHDYMKLDVYLNANGINKKHEQFLVHMKETDVSDCFGGTDIYDVLMHGVCDMGNYKRIVAPYYYLYLGELKVVEHFDFSKDPRIMNLYSFFVGLH